MGTGYVRNDTSNNIADGNVINASDLDGEFDAIQTAFNASTGHSHDGTTGEGPQITTDGLADDAVTGDKIDSTTTVTAASFVGPLTGDVAGNVTGNVTGDVTGNADTATALETARTIAGQSFDGTANISIAPTDLTGVTSTADEINKLDGATVTTAEINIVDGDTVATSTTVADADRVVYNDAGTMVQVAVTDLDTYFSGTTKTLTNKTLTSPVISSISNTGTLTLPTSTDTLVGRATTDTLTNKTLTSPTITTGTLNGAVSGTSIKDEDDMVSDSATHLATQQSIKAYVDSQVASKDALSELSGTTDDITEGTTNLFFTEERVDDRVNGLLVAGTNVSLTYDDTANTLTIASTDTDTGITALSEDTTPQLGGELDTNGNNISFGDSTTAGTDDTLMFGAGNDLQIYHNGSNSYISDQGTGGLFILASNFNIADPTDTENVFAGVANGAVNLYYDGSPKLATTSTGIDVTGTADMDTLSIGGTAVTATAAELNYVDGVTSAVQTQLDAKVATSDIGSTVQAYDADTLKADVADTLTAPFRGAVTAENDGSFDLNAGNNFTCTPTGAIDLTFTNETAGQSGMILLTNTTPQTITVDADVHLSASDLTAINVAGTYLMSYYCPDGTNVFLSTTPALTEGS